MLARRTFLTMLGAAAAQPDAILVFAAMTLKDALDQVAALYRASGAGAVTLSYGPTPTLVRQIESGASADVFFSADTDWMEYAQQHGLVRAGTRTDLLTSQLVLIAPSNSQMVPAPIDGATKLTDMLGDGRLAVCDPAAMPAGRYARAALRSLGLWPQVQDRIAIAETVRSVVLDVVRQEAPLGIVFDTDAALDPGVKVIGTFPADSHPPVIYPVALTSTAKPAAAAFLRFLADPTAAAVFRRAGYGVLRR